MIKRHARTKRHRPGKGLIPSRGNSLPEVYLSRTQTGAASVFDKDHFGSPASARFKWLISTVIAGTVGVAALGVALYGAMDVEDGSGMVESIKNASLSAMQPFTPKTVGEEQAISEFAKTDRLPATSQGLSTRYIIHDTIVQKRNDREFIAIKPYARIVARLATSIPESDEGNKEKIPLFNPFKLYANLDPVDNGEKNANELPEGDHAETKIVDLVSGILPDEDGQQLGDKEIQRIVASEYQNENFEIRATIYNEQQEAPTSEEDGSAKLLLASTKAKPLKNTSIIEKSIIIPDEDSIEGLENHIVAVGPKDNLQKILAAVKVSDWQAPAIAEAMEPIFSASEIKNGQELHLMLAPSLTLPDERDLVRVSIYESGVHIVSVSRNAAGEFIASNHGAHSALLEQLASKKDSSKATLYSSIYHASLKQNLPPKFIMKVLRIHAYDADFKQRVGPGDSFELFFDSDESSSIGEDGLGALLYTALTIGGETRRFYRYRTRDGEVDYYDENGDNAKRFLTRKPVRSGNVRLTSGFGLRHHPLLKRRKMHKGVDWAARRGTPIMAAGNGRIEAAKRHSGYGNYVRIRHANGYQTAYAHMMRFGKGIRKGVRVRQGQIIGYVGTTGLSSGPHLHYEILVNNRHVDPMRIHVPRGRQLRGKKLAEFQKERKRIETLMRRAPVKTRVAKNTN
ncbi:MAG: membrane protein [Rhodomicrobium sp.]|nr:MAG: membrane protein [Rhodomicrobium sp.]